MMQKGRQRKYYTEEERLLAPKEYLKIYFNNSTFVVFVKATATLRLSTHMYSLKNYA